MSDYLAALLVIGIVAGACLLPRLHVLRFRRCRCGRKYCIDCGRE